MSDETILSAAIDEAIALLPRVPESVISLGMQDLADGTDDDYLVPQQGENGLARVLLGVARRPVPWVALHLRAQGALVAYRILCAYAPTLAAHIATARPGLARRLLEHPLSGTRAAACSDLKVTIPRGTPRSILTSREWYPPALPQRALCVRSCGWSGLRTPRAVARVRRFLAAMEYGPRTDESQTRSSHR